MQLLSSLRRPALLLLAVVALLGAALPAAATLPPTEAKLVASNSTSLSFSVGIPADSDATELQVLVQTELNGNATTAVFPITLPGPVIVDIGSLRPNSGYVFAFSLASPANGSSEATKPNPALVRTHNVGPQIISFFAQDPTENTDSSDDDFFSNGDTITLAFDADTNQPGVGSKAEIDALFSFTSAIGAAYSGQWTSARVLVITIQDIGQSSPTLGSTFANVIGNIVQPDGLSDVSRSSSPPLIGSFSHSASTKRYFVPADRTKSADDFTSYNVDVEMDTTTPIPLALVWPADTSRNRGYGLYAGIDFPTMVDVTAFTLQGANWTTGTQVQETSHPDAGKPEVAFTNAELSKALQGLELVPKLGFIGFVAIRLTLVDRANGAAAVSTVFTTLHFKAPLPPDVPTLTVNGESGNLLSNPMGTIKTYKTPLIIALCSVVGFFVLLGLGICAYKKYRGGRDARDFEGQPLASSDDANRAMAGGDGGATRRFYYDAKV